MANVKGNRTLASRWHARKTTILNENYVITTFLRLDVKSNKQEAVGRFVANRNGYFSSSLVRLSFRSKSGITIEVSESLFYRTEEREGQG